MSSTSARMNITRDEAQTRGRLLRVASYDVVLDLTDSSETFSSLTTARFACTEPGSSTFIDLVAPQVDAITINGTEIDPADVFDGTRITLTGLAADNVLVVAARCSYMNTGEGLHRFVDPVDDAVYLYTQFEVSDSRRVYAVFEQPDLRATFGLTVTAPAHWQVVSNQPTPEPTPEPRSGSGASTEFATWRFAATPPLPSYVTGLVAGPYHRVAGDYRDGDRVVPLAVFCRQSLAEHLDADMILEETRQGFAYFERIFDRPYPFEKYDQLFVPEFNSGAMENAGCVTHTEDYVFRSRVPQASYQRRAVTTLHELAHMWFGDLVTMSWWEDLWLKESFAEWASTLAAAEATEWTTAWATFANTEKTWAYRQDQLPSTHPIAAEIRDLEDVEVNFDGITYAKGAAVLKQLSAWVGQDAFLAGIQDYFRVHAWGNTTLRDLLSKLEETSGRDLKAWSAEWLETAGVATLQPEVAYDDQGRFTSFYIVQTAPDAWPTLRSHRLAIGLYDRTEGALVRRDRIELDVTGARTSIPELVGVRAPDLVLVNDDDLAYAKIRLDARSAVTLTSSIGDIEDTLARSLCWSAAWDMTRDGELSTRDYLTLVLRGVGRETESSMIRTLLRQAVAASVLYAAPERRVETRCRLADGLAEQLRVADPGSDLQLQLARAVASTAMTDEHFVLVRGLLDGTRDLPGLEVDTDLRWHLLHHLVAAGRAQDIEIDAELARDDTATGRRKALSARTARPTEAAKALAWASVVDGDQLPNSMQTAVIGGFHQVGQDELLRPYVGTYFDSLDRIWADRTNETAQNLVVGLFPSLLPDPSTLDAADAWLDSHRDGTPALVRLVVEARDGIARALSAQVRDT